MLTPCTRVGPGSSPGTSLNEMCAAALERQRRQKKAVVYQCPNERQKWTNEEKRALLEAVKRHGSDDVSLLQPFVQSRSCKEIEWLIQKQKMSVKNNEQKRKINSPLDKWVMLVAALVEDEDKDFSMLLPQVMAVISQYEYSHQKSQPELGSKTPNYNRIYQYIESALLNKTATELSPIEAAVLLELMYGLENQLQVSELGDVKSLLLWKYGLLNAPVMPYNKESTLDMATRALENDWLGSSTDSSKRAGSPISPKGTSGGIVRPGPSGTAKGTTTQASDSGGSPPQARGRAPLKRHLVSTRCQDEPAAKKKSNHETRSASSQTELDSSEEQELHPLTLAEMATNPPVDEAGSGSPPQKVDRRRRAQPRKVFRKPPLYTLNPLCIPVSLLNLRSKRVL